MKPPHIALAPFFALVALLALPALAQGWRYGGTDAGKGRGRMATPGPAACAIGRWPDCDLQLALARGLIETGLKPAFAAEADCRGIDEGYAIDYGGKRDREQYHGGIDLPAPWGTPMIAAAAGTVVGRFSGERSFRGIEIVLRHAPEDTGLPLWIYTGYGHCAELPSLEPGRRVRMGETICATGNSGIGRTGTQSNRRRPAIHFSAFFSASEAYEEVRNVIVPADGYWMDPLALYRKGPPFDSAAMKALPEADKRVAIPVMFEDGRTLPADTRVVWPYACARR